MGVTKGDFMTNLSLANEVGKTDYTSAHEAAIIESFSIEVPSVFLDGTGSCFKDTFDAKALQLLRLDGTQFMGRNLLSDLLRFHRII